jgi:rubrerythrin
LKVADARGDRVYCFSSNKEQGVNGPLFFSTFILIFLAELGDKTQLAVMSQSAASSSKWTVFAAGVAALVASTAIGVLAGGLIRRFVPDERYIKCAGGLLFLLFGVLMLREVFGTKTVPVRTAAPPVSAFSDWIGRFVIQQAAVFEKAAFEDYEALAARSLDPEEKALYQRLAQEERWHHQAMLGAMEAGAGRDIPITAEMAGALPPFNEMMHDAVKAPRELEHAIEHERAMSRFYQILAEKSTLPRLRETFRALAAAEANHATRLLERMRNAETKTTE